MDIIDMKLAKMKRNPVVEGLNDNLIDEFSAYQVYTFHGQLAQFRGYTKLAAHFFDRAKDEHRHGEMLIARIFFLGGTPVVDTFRNINPKTELPAQLSNDKGLEEGAVTKYRALIKTCIEEGDAATRLIIEQIEKEEEEHIYEIVQLETQISDVTLAQFLSTQM